MNVVFEVIYALAFMSLGAALGVVILALMWAFKIGEGEGRDE